MSIYIYVFWNILYALFDAVFYSVSGQVKGNSDSLNGASHMQV